LGTQGIASLEFALVGAVLMMMMFGAIESSRYLFTVESVRTATAEAVRMVTIQGSANMYAGVSPCTGLTGALSSLASRTPFLSADALTATVDGCTTNEGVTTVSMSVTYPFRFSVPFFDVTRLTVTETAQATFH
jgi:Flp pilus assembly protein TadG